MSDPEIEELRDKVHRAVVLERTPPPWKLDRKESTKLSGYRRGKGEILIVSHGGKGWWDPTSDAKGDAFSLVQRLEPGSTSVMSESACANSRDCRLAFRSPKGQGVAKPRTTRRRTLGRSEGRVAGFADLALSCPEAHSSIGDHRGGFRGRRPAGGPGRQRLVRSFQRRGFRRPRRHSRADLQRLARGRRQSLFRLPPSAQSFPRLVLAEAAIDALSVAAIESLRADTLYAASGGAWGRARSPRSRRCSQPWRRSRRTLLQRHGRQWTGRSLRRTPPIARGKIQRAVRSASASNRRRRLEELSMHFTWFY